MSDDRIAEIRARHEQVPSGNLSIAAISLAHDDRALLLAEDERHRAEIERLRKAMTNMMIGWRHIRREREEYRAEVERLRAENERLLQAIGLVTTTVPDMKIDIENPVGMAQRVVAEFKKLREENERLRKRDAEWTQMAATWLASPEAERRLDGYRELAARVEGLTCERDEARAEVERLRKVYVLIATESAGIVEGGSIFEDKIAGCYASHQSADKAGEKLGYVNWRIEEHTIISNALEGKP